MVYSKGEIEKIAASGRILADVMAALKKEIKEGVSLKQLDDLARRLLIEAGAQPAFLGYRPDSAKNPYGFSICASVNSTVVHGAPTDYRLRLGNLLSIDCGARLNGFYSDAAFTVAVGKSSREKDQLISAVKEAFDEALKFSKPGNHLGDIGWAIERIAKKYNFSVIKTLTGHGIGRDLHEEPTIYNFGKKGQGMKLEAGMVLAIEPMFSAGSSDMVQLKDESWATSDGSLSAHYENTIAITATGPKVLTI